MTSDDRAAETLEAYLARLLVDPEARARFHAAPAQEARRAGLGDEDCLAVCAMDAGDLELAARSFARKRTVAATGRDEVPLPWWRRLYALAARAWRPAQLPASRSSDSSSGRGRATGLP